MTLVSGQPKESFRLSMLVYDTRFRSWTIQIIVLILFALACSWLIHNLVTNLAAKGKDINFGFLWNRAGYDINQRLVSYTNDSTHGRALLVGLLNTLLVAFLGCLLATVLGVAAGILRLSSNWLIARLMTVYVEVFRNIPVLLWILLAFVILTEVTPPPNAFKVVEGKEPLARMWLDGSVAVTNRGTNIPEPLFSRSLGTIDLGIFSVSLDLLAFIAVLVGAFYLNRLVLHAATATQETTGVRPRTWWKTLLIWILPVLALFYALGFHMAYPVFKGFNFQGGIQVLHSFTALLIALAVYTGAFIAEAVRAGVQAIPRGQSEAALSLGLPAARTMRLVVLPQALRVIIPPLISQYLNLTKNTSLAIAVSYMDLRGTLGGITLNQTGRELECMLLLMGIYLGISLIISSVMNIYNNAIRLKER